MYDSIRKIRQTKQAFNIAKLNQKFDRQLWGEDMPAMIINAGYAPTNNDITYLLLFFKHHFTVLRIPVVKTMVVSVL
ncbi:hypothetical protein [Lactobacillus gallinarum]|uniref:hypothetical protein n=1 Tax=Lactobacillus gallinarum TaxID=52242 RepID=UPI00242CFCF2|nr:hypothetical protein [Lactobacillus gallinarum]MDM8281543.1 hypothetical protein [Lactobacillus gallinarum]